MTADLFHILIVPMKGQGRSVSEHPVRFGNALSSSIRSKDPEPIATCEARERFEGMLYGL
ncbi:MAG: hypothetical protein AB1813_20800 [Verrucomicrobiota bacterium]